MPRAAIETGCVDVVLSPSVIGKELEEIIVSPNIFFTNENAPKNLDTIYDILIERLGTDFTDYKINTIQRRIHRRMAVNKIESLDKYVTYLKESSKEYLLLHKDLLVIVTSFFRDFEAFDSLKKVIRDIVSVKKRGDDIRMWVPGCATGEEVYSIAMVLHKELMEQNKASYVKVQIFATDISEEAVTEARGAQYFAEAVINIPPEYIDDYFIKREECYEVSKRIRDMVVFSKHDLIKDPPFINLDLISCRNLLIYFNSTLQKRLFAVFHHALRHKGYLFLGKSESTSGLTTMFATIDSKWKILQREETLSPPKLEYLQYYPKRYPQNYIPKEMPKKKELLDKEEVMNSSVASSIAQFFAKDYVIIDKENAIIYSSGNVKHYFDLPLGKMTNDILSFAKDDIKIDLRSAIYKTRRELKATTKKVHSKDERKNHYYISVLPMPNSDYFNNALLIMFSSIESDDISTKVMLSEQDKHELEYELMVTKERLQTTIEELETTNEELQSTNEELQSANEELRSTNEELETSNEELQSSNEELSTVNDELEMKSVNLREINADLNNAFESIDFGVMFVDEALKIRRYTPFIKEIFKVRAGDIGVQVTSIECNIDFPEFRKHLETVLKTKESKTFEFFERGVRYFCELKPFYNEHKRINGVTIIFQDKTQLYEREKKLQQLKEESERFKVMLRKVLDSSLDGVQYFQALRDSSGTITDFEYIFSNKVACEIIQKNENEIIGKKLLETIPGHLDTLEEYGKSLFEIYCEVVETGQSKALLFHFNAGGIIEWFSNKSVKLGDGFVVAFSVITEQVKKTEELAHKDQIIKQKTDFESFFENSSDAMSVVCDDKFRYVNQKAVELFGYKTKEELMHISPSALFSTHQKDGKSPGEALEDETLKAFDEKGNRFEYLLNRADGKTFVTEVTFTPIELDNKQVMHAIWRDVTEEKKLKESLENEVKRQLVELRTKEQQLIQQSKLASMGEMIGSIAHQWRQPLNIISLYKEHLVNDYYEKQLNDETVETYSDKIDVTLQHMSKTIDDFRNFFKPSKEKELFNVQTVIKEVIYIIDAQMKEHLISITFNNTQEASSLTCNGYANEFKQVVLNILNNAKDALVAHNIHSGEIAIGFEATKSSITVQIADNAGGIPEEIMDKIFEPYFTTKFQSQGTGLGLYMSKIIIEKNMGGKLTVENSENGAVFSIMLPCNPEIES